MAEDEEKSELQAEENTETDSQTATETPAKESEVNWEQRYKDLQADHTRNSQELARAKADLEAQAEKTTAAPEEEPEEYDPYDPKSVQKLIDKRVDDAVSKAIKGERQQRADSYFRRSYPEHVEDEGAISGILRDPKLRAEFIKCTSSEEQVDLAVTKFKERLEKASADAKTEAEEKAKQRDEQNRKAAGLGGPSTTPAKSDDEGLSEEQELKNRKNQQAKKRNLA